MNKTNQDKHDNIAIYDGDVPISFVDKALERGLVACDIETSGLNPRLAEIGTCQFYAPQCDFAVVQVSHVIPTNLIEMMNCKSIRKVFHHAVFDLSFMFARWQLSGENIACTKVASKLLDPPKVCDHSLQSLVMRHLGIILDKTERISDWTAIELSSSQLVYAVNDVRYLPTLLDILETELECRGLLELAHRCFEHLGTRAQLDFLEYDDLYQYY